MLMPIIASAQSLTIHLNDGSTYEGNYPYDYPNGLDSFNYGVEDRSSSYFFPVSEYYGRCGARPYTCNFLKKSGPDVYKEEAQTSHQSMLKSYKNGLRDEISSLDNGIERIQGVFNQFRS